MKKDMGVRKKIFVRMNQIVNKITGEVEEVERIYHKEMPVEDFIKVYIEDSCLLLKLKDHEIRFILALLQHVGYNNDIILTKEMKARIADTLGRSEQRVSDMLTDMVKVGLLERMSAGHYILNPEFAFRGDEKDKVNVVRRIIEYRLKRNVKDDN